MKLYKIKEVMTKQPITVSGDATIEQCAKIMTEKKIGSLIIEDNSIEGIITELDIVRKVVAQSKNPKTTLVKDVMTTNLITLTPEDNILDAVKLMGKHSIRHIPIVSKKDLEGFVTAKDIMGVEPKLFEEVIEDLPIREAESKPIKKR